MFQSMIESLAGAHDAPVFAPHVTVYSGACDAADDPVSILDRVTRSLSPLRLKIEGIRYSVAYTKTLFVQFAPLPQLSALSADLRSAVASPCDYCFDPHLSLMYKGMPEAAKQSIAAAIRLPRPRVCFDALWAVRGPSGTSRAEDVAQWEVVARKSFAD